MNIDTKLKDKLQKLLALAERGVGGEKRNAKAMLDAMLEKHNLTLADISSEEKLKRLFPYETIADQTIIAQIIRKVTNGTDVYILARSKKVTQDLTDYEYVMVSELIDFHLPQFDKERKAMLVRHKKERSVFQTAYVQKHRLFRERTEPSSEPSGVSEEELMELLRAMRNLEDVSYQKKLSGRLIENS